MIVAIRTDKPEAEIAICSATGDVLTHHTWLAHRELSSTLLITIREQLVIQKAAFKDITGIVVFKGPGSFTGLRIGVTVANTLAYGLEVPIIGMTGASWQKDGVNALLTRHNDRLVVPEYGAEAHITQPRR